MRAPRLGTSSWLRSTTPPCAPTTASFRRALHGRLINRVNAAEPRAIAEDITFGGPKPGDGVLVRALERARSRLVLATPLDYRVLTDEDE